MNESEITRQWIPVTEELPEELANVLACDSGYRVVEAYLRSNGVWATIWEERLDDVTHWMPLPEPPEAE